MIQFNEELAPLAYALFYRSYGRYHNGQRETIEDVLEGRTIEGLKTLGNLTPEEVALITKYQQQLKVFTSGRGLFVQGTSAATKPENVYSHYNCSNINIEGWSDFGLLMNLAMQGTGTGAKLEPQHINKLPPIRNKLLVEVKDEIGTIPANQRIEESKLNVIYKQEGIVLIELHVGDSRKGWVQAYQSILELSSADSITPLSNLPNVHFFRDESNYPTPISKLDLPLELSIHIYLANVRPKNEPLKGFGGVSNPSALPPLFSKCAAILNKAIGRQLNSVECCKLIDEAATTIVAGNIRRCLPLGTGIQTDWGITPIEDIGIGDRVLTTSGLKKVTDIFHQGQQPLISITTSDRCLYCSPNHKIAIPDEFITDSFHKLTKSNGKSYSMIPAIDLTIGQAIQISLMDEDEGDPYFLFGQFNSELQEALELEFFDPIQSNKPIEGLIPCFSFLMSKLQFLLLDNGYEYTTSPIMIGDYSRVSILIHDYERLNREPEVLQKIKDIYSTLIGNSYIYSSITHIEYDTGIQRATFDIEVEEAHEFYAEGILVSNSAGMRQGASDDKEFAVAKDNLWLQDSQGNWKIDLERDALRMSNHTRVFKHKPTYEECLAAVTKQYYSGEGAIQWAGEAVARSNADLLISKELKQEFLDKYVSSQQEAIDFLYTLNPYMDEREVQHRLGRWGLNPCYAAGTMVLTRKGSYPIESLVGKIVDIWDGEDWVTIDNFRVTGENQEVWKLTLSNGEDLIATPYHIFILKDGTRLPLKELKVGMELLGMVNNYSIVSITYSHIADKVYCCTVPTTNTFALSNGVLTGNCGEIIGEDFLCVSGDTLLITKDGLHKIKDLVGEEVEIWNGKQWSRVSPFKTGSNRILYRVKFRDGSYLDTTENHRFFVKDRFNKYYKEVETKDLMSVSKYVIHTEPFKIEYEDGIDIDTQYAYSLGVTVGDGNIQSDGKPIVRLYGKKMELEIAGRKSPLRSYSYSPDFKDITRLDFSGELVTALKHNPDCLNIIASWNKEAILYFMAGMADTDGSNTDSNGIRIYISDYERAYRCQLLLTKCGIRSSVNLCAEKGAVTNKGTRSKDLYYLQITDCGQLPCQRLDVSKGCNPRFKGKWQVVESVVQLAGTHDTYCFTESEFHKGVFGNTLTGNCNLSDIQLNLFDPLDPIIQREAFRTAGLMVAILLNHKFPDEITQYSREIDPIVGVSFNGLFDFFVNALGIEWLRWWQSDRDKKYQGELQPEFKSVAEVLNIDVNNYQEGDAYKLGQLFYDIEKAYLSMWKQEVFSGVYEYCDARGLKRPNRTTCVQPGGSKALLTGASSGWHPPKAAWFIRRMTFRREDPIALAALDYGYTIVPSQSCKDEEGNLLNDPFDPRVDEWLLEVPVQVAWADIPGVEDIDISQLSAESQWDFYMNVQEHYTTHNCFSRDTSFLTPQGLKTFYDFEVNDKVIVLNADGDWSEATIIKTNDVRPMLELSLVEETTNIIMTITCTYCHRFPIGSLILTAKELQVGMTLSLNPLALQDCSWTIESIREAEPQEGWCVMEPITHHFTLSNNILVMNSSGTIEFQEHEISIMASNIFHSIQNDEGYISVALLQRLTSYFPRLPMEPISKTTYIELRKGVLSRRKSPDFHSLLQHYSQLSGLKYSNPQDSACEGLICELRSFS